MIYFLYGDNDYRIDQRVAELRNQFAAKYGEDNVATVDVNRVTGADLMTQLTALSLLTQHQMIIVKAVTSVNEDWTLLENSIDYIPDDTVAVLTDVKSLSKVRNIVVTRTFKKLKAGGAKLEKYDLVKSRDLRLWLADEVKRRALYMDKGAQSKLLQLTAGEDNQQARLDIELGKLALLQKPITAQLVEEYVEASPDTNAFAIFGAAITGKTERAIELLRQLRDSGEDSNRFIGLLASQELALASAITGAKVKLSTYQLAQARDLAYELGDNAHQLAKLRRIAAVLAELDGQVKLAKPGEAWLRIEIALASLSN